MQLHYWPTLGSSTMEAPCLPSPDLARVGTWALELALPPHKLQVQPLLLTFNNFYKVIKYLGVIKVYKG